MSISKWGFIFNIHTEHHRGLYFGYYPREGYCLFSINIVFGLSFDEEDSDEGGIY